MKLKNIVISVLTAAAASLGVGLSLLRYYRSGSSTNQNNMPLYIHGNLPNSPLFDNPRSISITELSSYTDLFPYQEPLFSSSSSLKLTNNLVKFAQQQNREDLIEIYLQLQNTEFEMLKILDEWETQIINNDLKNLTPKEQANKIHQGLDDIYKQALQQGSSLYKLLTENASIHPCPEEQCKSAPHLPNFSKLKIKQLDDKRAEISKNLKNHINDLIVSYEKDSKNLKNSLDVHNDLIKKIKNIFKHTFQAYELFLTECIDMVATLDLCLIAPYTNVAEFKNSIDFIINKANENYPHNSYAKRIDTLFKELEELIDHIGWRRKQSDRYEFIDGEKKALLKNSFFNSASLKKINWSKKPYLRGACGDETYDRLTY